MNQDSCDKCKEFYRQMGREEAIEKIKKIIDKEYLDERLWGKIQQLKKEAGE